MSTFHPVIIIGAGPAGIGVGALLARCAIPCVILERGSIGESFHQWPRETRFISPSFTGNFFGAVDLNAITPESSPAFGFQNEHPTGRQYARYLKDVAQAYDLHVQENITVEDIEPSSEGIIKLSTNEGDMQCRALIWAGGEAQFPKHIPDTIRVGRSYKDFPADHHVIIGGAESGIETAFNLVRNGSTVSIIDPDALWDKRVSDSSYGLSPFTCARVRYLERSGKAEFIAETADVITKEKVVTKTRSFTLGQPAIDATGFDITQSLAGTLFDFPNGYPELTEHDESTKHKNIYLVGPQVQHDLAVFCFIYKYRQRFAVVVREILKRWGEESLAIQEYAEKGFLLDDLSCCEGECVC